MARRSMGSRRNQINAILIVAGLILVVILVVVAVFISSQNQPAPQAPAPSATLAPAASPTPTLAPASPTPAASSTPLSPTPTLTAVIPSATPIPPTATAVPPLAIVKESFQIRCLRNDYQLPITSPAVFSSPDLLIQKVNPGESGFEVTIPVRACGVFVTFNQPVTDEVFVDLFEGTNATPWYRRALVKVADEPNAYYALLEHDYIIDLPYWNTSYPMKIRGKDQTYWEGGLNLSKTFIGLCWEGSIPDPVTFKCPKADRLEREPHPDMPTFVPGGIKN